MEAVIFCGIPAAGKSTFYVQRFFTTHVRINLDMLRTRRREKLLLDACLAGQQPFVVDNTNVRREDRATYIAIARERGFRVVGYYFATEPKAALARNRARVGKAAVPAPALFASQKRLEIPALSEGFDQLYRVEIGEGGTFVVTPMVS
ncbi:MAG TPA: AAA family ATPase [Gemmatimonadaceae bacterium]|nr:AAA family ATPase [Gemmatimonadaceae bacterium]